MNKENSIAYRYQCYSKRYYMQRCMLYTFILREVFTLIASGNYKTHITQTIFRKNAHERYEMERNKLPIFLFEV